MIPLRTAWSTPVGLLASVLLLACGGGDGGGMTGPPAGARVVDLDLSVGETRSVAVDGQVLTLRLPSADAAREYRLTVQTGASAPPNQVVPMRLTRNGGGSGSASISAARRPAAGAGPIGLPGARDLLVRERLQESSRRHLTRHGVSPAREGERRAGRAGVRTDSRLPTGSAPAEGDTLEFWFAAQEGFETTCDTDSARTITAVVEAKRSGGRSLIVQDTAAPDPAFTGGGFSQQDFTEIAATFDTLVVPTDSAYFGRPTDIDGNGRVYVLFTPKVNDLDPDQGETQVGGFFIPQDLAESGDATGDGAGTTPCPASNEAEVLYLRAPDPSGEFGNRTSADEARRNAFSVSSHELQHLLNAANRVIKGSGGFGQLEDTWLNEGLSHLAEEIVGLAALDAPVRSNLTFSETGGQSAEQFNTYLINDFFNAGLFMKNSPTVPALVASEPQDTELGSLQMRGFAWMFLRWLADHTADAAAEPPPGSGEERLFRDLAQADGSELSTGIENVEGVAGGDFDDLLADFGLMVAVDDTVSAARGRRLLPSWNLRNMYRELAANVGQRWRDRFGEYPLAPVQAGFGAGETDFEVKPGAGQHFVFSSSGSTPELRLDLTDQTGSALGGAARITIIRAR